MAPNGIGFELANHSPLNDLRFRARAKVRKWVLYGELLFSLRNSATDWLTETPGKSAGCFRWCREIRVPILSAPSGESVYLRRQRICAINMGENSQTL